MRPAVLLLAVALLVGACGDDSGNGVDGQTATTPSSAPTDSTGPDPDGVAGDPPEPLAVADPEAPPAGSARIVLGAVVDEVLTVDSCVLDGPSTPDGAVPVEPIAVTASAGTGAERIALDLRRFVQLGFDSFQGCKQR